MTAEAKDAAAFKSAVKAKYPAMLGEQYLDMTTGAFFPQKK